VEAAEAFEKATANWRRVADCIGGVTQGTELVKEWEQSLSRERAVNGGMLPPGHFLAISGGGGDGAFGAGLICGWAETGTRPKFKLVTGISTGSMIAPCQTARGASTLVRQCVLVQGSAKGASGTPVPPWLPPEA
jgi:hypothetical protein